MLNLDAVRNIDDARRLAINLLKRDKQGPPPSDMIGKISPRRVNRNEPLIRDRDFRTAVDYVLQPWSDPTPSDHQSIVVKEKITRMQNLQQQKQIIESEHSNLRQQIERLSAATTQLRNELGTFVRNEVVQIVHPQQEAPPPTQPQAFGTWQEIERIATGGKPVTVGDRQPALPVPRFIDTTSLIVNMPPPPLSHPSNIRSSPRDTSHSPWAAVNTFRPVTSEGEHHENNRRLSPTRDALPVNEPQPRAPPIPMPQPTAVSSLDQQVVDELRQLRLELRSTKEEVEQLRKERQEDRPSEIPPKPEPPPTPTPFAVSNFGSISEPPVSIYKEEQTNSSDLKVSDNQESTENQQRQEAAALKREAENPSPSWASEEALLSEVDEFVRNLESSKPTFTKHVTSMSKNELPNSSITPTLLKTLSGPGGISVFPASLPQPIDQSPARLGGGWSAPGSTRSFRSNSDIMKIAESGIEGSVRPMTTPTPSIT